MNSPGTRDGFSSNSSRGGPPAGRWPAAAASATASATASAVAGAGAALVAKINYFY